MEFTKEITISSRKSRYFKTIGLNGVLDLSDSSENSQVAALGAALADELTKIFQQKEVLVDIYPVEEYEAIAKNVAASKSDKRFLTEFLERIEKSNVKEKLSTTKNLYAHVVETLLYNEYMFNEDEASFVTEADFIVKLWSRLLELTFRGTGVILHWGDTIPENCKTSFRMKFDLRIISHTLSCQAIKADLASGEFARSVDESKLYRDKLKGVLTSKLNINQRYKETMNLGLSFNSIQFNAPFIVVMGHEAVLYNLSKSSDDPYMLYETTALSFPSSVEDIKNNGIADLIRGLKKIKVRS